MPAAPDLSYGEQPRGRRRIAGLAFVLAVAAVVTAALIVSGRSQQGGEPVAGPFGTHYRDLERRRVAAGVPTMAEGDTSIHLHPKLEIVIDDEPVAVPAGIGIGPGRGGRNMAGLHTHGGDGTIHVEGVRGATLGQFFKVWGVPFSSRRIGSFEAARDGALRMTVNGEPSSAFDRLVLDDDQVIRIVAGPKRSS